MKKSKIKVGMDIDEPTLVAIDEAAKTHRMSRTGLMVYATLKYMKEVKE